MLKNEINKISCSEFWKGKNSYANLQDNYHKYLTKCGFNLERSRNVENTHLAIKDLKVITNFEEQQFLNKSSPHVEEMIPSDDVAEIKEHYKKVIRKYNTLSQQYIKVKAINETNQKSLDDLNHKCSTLEHKCSKLEKTCKKLNNYIQKTFETISHLIGWSIKQLKQVVNEHIIEERQQELEKELQELDINHLMQVRRDKLKELQEELLQDNETNLIDTKDRYFKN